MTAPKAEDTQQIESCSTQDNENMKILTLDSSKQCGKVIKTKPPLPTLRISKAVEMQRQRTMTLLNYKRKSLSQLDFKEALRASHTLPSRQTVQAEAVVSATDPLIAGTRIFNEVMLNSWRKRGQSIKQLTAQIERQQQNFQNFKNQLHVYKSLFAAEQTRTQELSEQLNTANELIAKLEQSESLLKSQLATSETKCNNAEQQLLIKTQDHHVGSVYFKQTKNELYKLMSDHEETKRLLQAEEHKTQELQAERSRLLLSIQLISAEAGEVRCKLRSALEKKCSEVTDVTNQLEVLKRQLKDNESKYDLEFERLGGLEIELKKELEALQAEAEVLRRCLAGTVGQRVRNCWHNSAKLQRTTLGFVHWFAAALLPVLPPPVSGAPGIPSLPHCLLTIEKAMNMVKR